MTKLEEIITAIQKADPQLNVEYTATWASWVKRNNDNWYNMHVLSSGTLADTFAKYINGDYWTCRYFPESLDALKAMAIPLSVHRLFTTYEFEGGILLRVREQEGYFNCVDIIINKNPNEWCSK